jgi:ribonuclease HII
LYLNDSKQLSAAKREQLYDEIMEKAISVGVGIVGPDVIDEINILQADYEAMRQAVGKLSVIPQVLLNDAVTIPGLPMIQENIIHGDAKSLSIAAASVIAKVTRDRMMVMYDELYPEYGFAKNKGYGSAAHEAAIREHGLCPIHRRSFTSKFRKQEESDERK